MELSFPSAGVDAGAREALAGEDTDALEAGSLSSVASATDASKDEVGKLSAWDERSLAASLGSTASSL